MNSTQVLDTQILPASLYVDVLTRNYSGLINKFKKNIPLTKKLSNFYYEIMLVNYQNFIKSKTGSCNRVPWFSRYQQQYNKPLVVNMTQQHGLVRYIFSQQQYTLVTNSNFGYLMFVLGQYLRDLQQAYVAINTAQGNLPCYYKLGKNINSPQQLQNYLQKFVY